jgi:hypothetical protein
MSFWRSWLLSRGYSTRKLWLENERLRKRLALSRQDEHDAIVREARLEKALETIVRTSKSGGAVEIAKKALQ